jgi:hypothetical protein
MRELTARRSREEWMLLLDIAFRSERDVLATEFPHLGFELLLLRLANAQGLLSVDAIESVESPASRQVELRAAVPPVLPTAGVPQQREARIGAPPPATFSRKPPGRETVPAPVSAKAVSPAASGLWDALKRVVEGKRKAVLVSLLSQMEGEVRDGELVISCGHGVLLERLKEPDKWQPLLAALEEAAGRAIPVRLSISTEKKSPELDAVAPADAGLERRALEEPAILEILRTFEGSMLVKVQPAPSVEVPRNGTASDEDAGEPEIPETEAE